MCLIDESSHMSQLATVYSSNTPVDCHIVKGRLESEGIPCFIYDEHIIWVHPFRAVAIGGVKLKVPFTKYPQSQRILDQIEQGILLDKNGKQPISEVLEKEFQKHNKILTIKSNIRKDPSLLEKPETLESVGISISELEEIIHSERTFNKQRNTSLQFSWKQFLFELFDYERSVFKYLKTKPTEYYLEKELVENYQQQKPSVGYPCPNCKSDNTSFGYAIDYTWDLLYLILSFLLAAPFFLIRKKYHCFNCGYNFRRKRHSKHESIL